MHGAVNVGRTPATAKRSDARQLKRVAGTTRLPAMMVCAIAAAAPAHAVDGCLVLLCLAAPSWRGIPDCVPPVQQVLRDLARGRPFPNCPLTGSGASASHAWASAPGNCPPQYVQAVEMEVGTRYECTFTGAVSVLVDGGLFSRTWWNWQGDSVTEFTLSAKAQLQTWESRFDDDYARWLAAQPAPPAEPTSEGV